jgi:hypothetical protein
MQRIMRHYRDVTGQKEVDMRDVTKFAVAGGWPLPEPMSPLDRLTRDFAAAAREEIRTDKATGRPYRVNHVYQAFRDGEQLHLWVDIDEAPREPIVKSLQMRREQMVGDAVQLSFDAEHWNRINPEQEPIVPELDFGPDVEWRKNAPPEDEVA